MRKTPCFKCQGTGHLVERDSSPEKKSKTIRCPICFHKRAAVIGKVYKMSTIWYHAWHNFLMYKKMASPATPEEKQFIDQNCFFSHIRHVLFRTAVIETVKLIAPYKEKYTRDRYAIPKLLKTHNTGIDLWRQKELWEVIREDHRAVYDGLLMLRDKVYAHTDNREIKDAGFTSQQFELFLRDLRELILDLTNVLAFGLLNKQILMGDALAHQIRNWDDFQLLMEAKKARRLGLAGA